MTELIYWTVNAASGHRGIQIVLEHTSPDCNSQRNKQKKKKSRKTPNVKPHVLNSAVFSLKVKNFDRFKSLTPALTPGASL